MLICSWFIWMPVLLSVCPLKVRLFPPLKQLSRALMQRHVRFASPPPTSRNSSTAASSLALKLVNSTAATSFKDALLSQKNPRIKPELQPLLPVLPAKQKTQYAKPLLSLPWPRPPCQRLPGPFDLCFLPAFWPPPGFLQDLHGFKSNSSPLHQLTKPHFSLLRCPLHH